MRCRSSLCSLALAALLLLAAPAAQADYASARAAYMEGDYATALAEFIPLSQKGDPRAQFTLAEMYFNGFGVEVEHREAYRWYQRAAENGHAPAQLQLGAMLAMGTGVDKNAADAYYWIALSVLWSDSELRRAAMQGLGDVAKHLTLEEKSVIEDQARGAWE